MPKKGQKPTEKQLAALEAGRQKFCQGEPRTKEASEKGAEKSAEVRAEAAQRRRFAEEIAEELDMVTTEGTTRKNAIAKKLVQMLVDADNPETLEKLFKLVRDTIGEMPTTKTELTQEKPFEINVKVIK